MQFPTSVPAPSPSSSIVTHAHSHMDEASQRVIRRPDGYLWLHGDILLRWTWADAFLQLCLGVVVTEPYVVLVLVIAVWQVAAYMLGGVQVWKRRGGENHVRLGHLHNLCW